MKQNQIQTKKEKMTPKKAKPKRLSKKQEGFIRDFVKTGNATEAASRNYDVKNRNVAHNIGSENLQKPTILAKVKSIAESIPDELLVEKHLSLLHATHLDHSIFPPFNNGDKKKKRGDELTDEMIIELLASVNCTVKKIVHGDQARHVYFWGTDNRAIKDGLDMAYKIKNTYAPETMNFKFTNYDNKQLVDMLLAKLKKK